MSKIIIISKHGQCVNKKVKELNINKLYKYCNLKKATKNFTVRQTWKVGNVFISVYAKDNGRAGSENKYELPPPVDSDLYFGNLVIICHSEKELNNDNVIDLDLKDWEKIYESLMGGSESLNEDEEDSDEDDIPDELKTSGGYMKDGFVVDDNEDIEYDTSDNLDEDEEDEEDEEDDEDDDEEESYEGETEEESDEDDYISSCCSELETEQSSEEDEEEEEEDDTKNI